MIIPSVVLAISMKTLRQAFHARQRLFGDIDHMGVAIGINMGKNTLLIERSLLL